MYELNDHKFYDGGGVLEGRYPDIEVDIDCDDVHFFFFQSLVLFVKESA